LFHSCQKEFKAPHQRLFSSLVGAEPKLVDDFIFFLSQFSRCTTLDGDNIPPAAMRHGAFRRFDESRVLMQAAAEMPAIIPGRFIVPLPYCWRVAL
jgi:hypothetical protein